MLIPKDEADMLMFLVLVFGCLCWYWLVMILWWLVLLLLFGFIGALISDWV